MNMITEINKPTHTNPLKKMVQTFYHLAIALLVTGLMITNAQAQDRTLSLDEAIKLGIQNSKVLKLSQSKIDQAVSRYNQTKDLALPTGNASFTYDRAEIPVNSLAFGSSTIDLPKNANAYLGIVSLNEAIFAGGKYKYAREST